MPGGTGGRHSTSARSKSDFRVPGWAAARGPHMGERRSRPSRAAFHWYIKNPGISRSLAAELPCASRGTMHMGAADGRLSESFSRMIPGFCSAEIAAMCATSRFGGRATPIEPPQASRPSPHGHRRADHSEDHSPSPGQPHPDEVEGPTHAAGLSPPRVSTDGPGLRRLSVVPSIAPSFAPINGCVTAQPGWG